MSPVPAADAPPGSSFSMPTPDAPSAPVPAAAVPPIAVFLADDQHLVRAGFRMVLESQPDMVVVGEAADGRQAVEQLRHLRADVVLMDVRMPVQDGIAATADIVGPGPSVALGSPRVVVLTTFDLDEYALAAIRAGASGFLLKDAPPEELLAAVRTVHAGDAVVAPSTTRRLLEHVAALPDPVAARARAAQAAGALTPLTDREREVLLAVGRGLSNQEIAAGLFLSEATVKTHIGRIFAKCGLRDRVQAVILAYDTGLVHPGS